MTTSEGLVVWTALVYLALGIPAGLVFVLLLAPRLDPGARAGSILFRLIVLPAAVLLWPLVIGRSIVAFRDRSSLARPT